MKNTLISIAICFILTLAANAQTKVSGAKEPVCTGTVIMGVELVAEGIAVMKSCTYEAKQPDGATHKLWKEVYGVKDGKIVLVKTLAGRIVPARIDWAEKP